LRRGLVRPYLRACEWARSFATYRPEGAPRTLAPPSEHAWGVACGAVDFGAPSSPPSCLHRAAQPRNSVCRPSATGGGASGGSVLERGTKCINTTVGGSRV
jgi:hypothetical protein